MGEFLTVTQHPCGAVCPWKHADGAKYGQAGIFPSNVCPILYHSLYPYFLGLLYNADMQDIWVCCPGEHGVDCLVRKETNNGTFDFIPDDWWVIYAEIVNVGDCPKRHPKGERIIFPTWNKKRYMCPAGVNNILPMMDIEMPSCINKDNLRCPDWKETVYYKLEGK